MVGTVQQVAGAAGTATFIAVMSASSASLLTDGLPEISAQAGGIHIAFLLGATISVLAFAATFFVRRVEAGTAEGARVAL